MSSAPSGGRYHSLIAKRDRIPDEFEVLMATVLMRIKVKPKARVSSLERTPDGTWLAKLKSPPVDGKANAELVTLVAEHFRCGKASVVIKSGASARTKLVQVEVT
jgi:uncharacterized protein (TIGR00251 family)